MAANRCHDAHVNALNAADQSNSQKQSTIAHEFGHAIGLSEHNYKANTIKQSLNLPQKTVMQSIICILNEGDEGLSMRIPRTKIYIFLVSGLLILCLAACQNTNSNAAIVDNNEKSVQNEIHESEIILTQKEIPLEFQGKRVIEENSVLDLAYRPTLEEVISHSAAIVRATVNDVEYTSIAAHAWTVIDATVEDVLLGDVERAADINIYAYGGYISMKDIADAENDRERYVGMTDEELENTIIHQEANMEESPLIDEQYIFFLGNPTADMPIDSYEKLGWKFCQMLVGNNKNLYYTPYITKKTSNDTNESEDISSMSLTQLQTLIDQYTS